MDGSPELGSHVGAYQSGHLHNCRGRPTNEDTLTASHTCDLHFEYDLLDRTLAIRHVMLIRFTAVLIFPSLRRWQCKHEPKFRQHHLHHLSRMSKRPCTLT
jgi:hypothetical protein